MKRRTLAVLGYFGRYSCTLVGTGLIVLGIGYGIQTACMTMASQREA